METATQSCTGHSWWVTATILNGQLQTADKSRSFSLGLGVRPTAPHCSQEVLLSTGSYFPFTTY